MEFKEFKNYTKNTHAYTASEVEELEPMTDIELEQYQYELDEETGNLSNWDHIRAIITLKKKNKELESQISELVCGIYEHANEGTQLMELAERIDEKE
jgi:hypothetical protein